MLDRNLQHPAISHALRTGYPTREAPPERYYCSKCGAEIDAEQSANHLCAQCEEKALERFKFLLLNEFTERERQYIDLCVEGNSLTEPEKIKDIKAIYTA